MNNLDFEKSIINVPEVNKTVASCANVLPLPVGEQQNTFLPDKIKVIASA